MIVYNSKDIVKRAKQLADLQNSDFISYEENVTLLNDAYTQLYQKAIDAGDKIYLKTMELKPEEYIEGEDAYCLPDDFYQLYSIQQVTNLSVDPVLRRSKNTPKNGISYDIIENKLYIYGCVTGNLKIEYFPILDTITIKRDPFKLESLNIDGESLSICESKLLVNDSLLKKFIVYNIQTGKELYSYDYSEFAIEQGITNIVARIYENGIFITFDINETHYVLKGMFRDKPSISITSSILLPNTIIEDEKKYYTEPTLSGTVDSVTEAMIVDKDTYHLTIMKSDNSIIVDMNDKTLDITSKVNVKITDLKKNSLAFVDGCEVYLILENNGNRELYICNMFTEQVEKVQLNGAEPISIKGLNLVTGYGYLVHNEDNIGELVSCFEDTVLDYPNNFYFSYLAYMLAVSYKIKQGADPSLLLLKVQSEAEAYFDTYKRDANMPIRISNAYNY